MGMGMMAQQSSSSDDDDEDEEEDDEDPPQKQAPTASVEGAYADDYADLNVSADVRDLFQYIGRYAAHEVELESTLKCFVPDYIPAVGEMDAFLKVPRPDGQKDNLGCRCSTSRRRRSPTPLFWSSNCGRVEEAARRRRGPVHRECGQESPGDRQVDQIHRGPSQIQAAPPGALPEGDARYR